MTAFIRWTDKVGTKHKVPAKALHKGQRWAFSTQAMDASLGISRRGVGATWLGDGNAITHYTGGIIGHQNEVISSVFKLVDGAIVEVKYFPGFDCDLVIKEAAP